jgi:hypothetical protein
MVEVVTVRLIDGVAVGLATTAAPTASVCPLMLLALLAVQSPPRPLPLADLRLATANRAMLKWQCITTVRLCPVLWKARARIGG